MHTGIFDHGGKKQKYKRLFITKQKKEYTILLLQELKKSQFNEVLN